MDWSAIFGSAFVLTLILTDTQSMVCPDGHSKCRDTPLEGELNRSDCYLKAQCCSDGMHCCPKDTKCNDKEGSCDPIVGSNRTTDALTSPDHYCPDHKKQCPRSETCCQLKTGGYGCCTYSLAVCCEDMLHCCPHGTRCDVIHRQCVRPSDQTNVKSSPIRLIGTDSKNKKVESKMVCPGGDYTCPDGNTCCQLNVTKTQWGCCPLTDAVCCVDGYIYTHCCPKGHRCNVGGCDRLV